MTTNSPESLPPALLRPGRIDSKVKFGLASQEQIKTLFLQMYEGYEGKPGNSMGVDVKEGYDLKALATEFVSELPDKKFPSAAVQGFLLTKTDPSGRRPKSWEVQVMETRKRVLGAEHPSTLTSMNSLAYTWRTR